MFISIKFVHKLHGHSTGCNGKKWSAMRGFDPRLPGLWARWVPTTPHRIRHLQADRPLSIFQIDHPDHTEYAVHARSPQFVLNLASLKWPIKRILVTRLKSINKLKTFCDVTQPRTRARESLMKSQDISTTFLPKNILQNKKLFLLQ